MSIDLYLNAPGTCGDGFEYVCGGVLSVCVCVAVVSKLKV